MVGAMDEVGGANLAGDGGGSVSVATRGWGELHAAADAPSAIRNESRASKDLRIGLTRAPWPRAQGVAPRGLEPLCGRAIRALPSSA